MSKGICPHSPRPRTDHIVSADQAARQRRAAETVLLSDVGCGVRRFSRGHQASRPGGRQAADSIVARDQVCQLLASARPWRPKAASRRGGAAVEYSLRTVLQLQQPMSRLTFRGFRRAESESGGPRLTRALQLLMSIESHRPCEPAAARLTRAKACVRTRRAHR